MASIRKCVGVRGTSYRVLFRQDGVQTSITLPDERSAVKAKKLIEALGVTEALERLAGRVRSAAAVPTVDEWVEEHIGSLTGVTARTREDYRRLAKRHVSPHLGAYDVDEVTPKEVSDWANRVERDVSGKTLANVRGLLSAAFAYAVEAGHREDNPMRRLRRSRALEHERAEMTCLTPEEVTLLVEAMPAWRPFILLLAGTGLRFGEAIALTVGDVELGAPVPIVRVTKAVRRTPTGFEVGPPKTSRSRRHVSLSRELVDVLAPLVEGRQRDANLFTGALGARVHHSNFHGRHWQPGLKVARARGLTASPRIHDLRHSHASWLISAGVPIPVIQARLGHESITTTVDTYGHLMPDHHQQAASALDGMLSRPAPPAPLGL